MVYFKLIDNGIPCKGEFHRPFSRTCRSRLVTTAVCDLHPEMMVLS